MKTIPALEILPGSHVLQNRGRKRRYRLFERLLAARAGINEWRRQIPTSSNLKQVPYRLILVLAALVCVLLVGITLDYYAAGETWSAVK